MKRVFTPCAVAALLAFTSAAHAVPVLDQEHDGTTDANVSFWNDGQRAQTFTAGLSGTLSSVEARLFRSTLADPNASMTVAIHDSNGSLPGSTVLGSVNTTLGILPTSASPFTSFDLSALAISIAAGQVYAIVITTSHPLTYAPGWAGRLGSSSYAGGEMHLSTDGGTTWIPQGSVGTGGQGLDGFFRTYVDSNDVPAPATLALMVLGLLGLGRRYRRISGAA